MLIVKPSSLGDIVQSFPVLAQLRAAFPDAQIGWVARDRYAPFLARHPQVDVVFSFERKARGLRLVWNQWDLARRMRGFCAHVAIDLQGLARSAWFTYVSGAPIRVGMSDCREGARLAYTHTVPIPRRLQHAVDRYQAVAQAILGAAADSPVERVRLPEDEAAARWAETTVAQAGNPPLAVAPGARWVTKRWPVVKFAHAAEQIALRTGLPVVVLGSTAEIRLGDELTRLLAPRIPCINLCGRTDLLQLTELLRRCRLLLGNDSGTAHLAAAVGCPVVAVFTCTSPRRAAPRGQLVRVVQTSLRCRGSYLKHCPHLSCHAELSAEPVVLAALELLAARPAAPVAA